MDQEVTPSCALRLTAHLHQDHNPSLNYYYSARTFAYTFTLICQSMSFLHLVAAVTPRSDDFLGYFCVKHFLHGCMVSNRADLRLVLTVLSVRFMVFLIHTSTHFTDIPVTNKCRWVLNQYFAIFT